MQLAFSDMNEDDQWRVVEEHYNDEDFMYDTYYSHLGEDFEEEVNEILSKCPYSLEYYDDEFDRDQEYTFGDCLGNIKTSNEITWHPQNKENVLVCLQFNTSMDVNYFDVQFELYKDGLLEENDEEIQIYFFDKKRTIYELLEKEVSLIDEEDYRDFYNRLTSIKNIFTKLAKQIESLADNCNNPDVDISDVYDLLLDNDDLYEVDPDDYEEDEDEDWEDE